MAPTTRNSKTKRALSSSQNNPEKQNKCLSNPQKKENVNEVYGMASEDSECTDLEMEFLVEQTFQKMSKAMHKTKRKESNSDIDPEAANVSRQTGRKKNEDILPFVLDTNPNSRSNVRIEVDHCGTTSNEKTKITNEVNEPQLEGKDAIDTSSNQPVESEPAAAQEQAEDEFISLDPSDSLSRDEQKRQGSARNRKINNGKLKEPDIRIKKVGPKRVELVTELDSGLDPNDTYLNFVENESSEKKTSAEMVLLKSSQDKLLKKSVITPDFEKRHSVPPYRVAMRQLKRQKKKERDSTTGADWYGMAAAEMTDTLRNDIKAVRMRATLDPKRFYKHNDMTAMPKFVQVGTIVESPADFYHSRVPKKQRKQTIVEELLADAETRRYNKRKYLELQERSQRRGQRPKWNKGKKKGKK